MSYLVSTFNLVQRISPVQITTKTSSQIHIFCKVIVVVFQLMFEGPLLQEREESRSVLIFDCDSLDKNIKHFNTLFISMHSHSYDDANDSLSTYFWYQDKYDEQ